MPSSVKRSIRMSGQSVMVAILATTGRFSFSTMGRAVIDRKVREVEGMTGISRQCNGAGMRHDREFRKCPGNCK
jgi:hypothetical protein